MKRLLCVVALCLLMNSCAKVIYVYQGVPAAYPYPRYHTTTELQDRSGYPVHQRAEIPLIPSEDYSKGVKVHIKGQK